MNWVCNRCGRMYPTSMDFCPKDNISQVRDIILGASIKIEKKYNDNQTRDNSSGK